MAESSQRARIAEGRGAETERGVVGFFVGEAFAAAAEAFVEIGAGGGAERATASRFAQLTSCLSSP